MIKVETDVRVFLPLFVLATMMKETMHQSGRFSVALHLDLEVLASD